MPTKTIIVVAGIALAFILFAGTLAWADLYSRKRQDVGSTTNAGSADSTG